MAAKHKAALSGSAISPEQQLQPSTPPAPCQTNPDKVPKQELQQAEPEPGPLDSEDPPSAVKELDKQEVELLVSLMQGRFVVTWLPCMNIQNFTL